jgi:hypothetical protein
MERLKGSRNNHTLLVDERTEILDRYVLDRKLGEHR